MGIMAFRLCNRGAFSAALLLVAVAFSGSALPAQEGGVATEDGTFTRDVLPIIQDNC